MKDIRFVILDDWVAVYVDGNMKAQGHDLSARKILEILDIEYEKLYLETENLEEFGYTLPSKFEELTKFVE